MMKWPFSILTLGIVLTVIGLPFAGAFLAVGLILTLGVGGGRMILGSKEHKRIGR